MTPSRIPPAAWSRWALLLVAAGCSELKSQGEQCGFNDDCYDPLVCAALRCRAQCRSDRDCVAGQICAPSEAPTKRVCVARTEQSLCANDQSCPRASACVSNSCWWRCASDGACAARGAGVCSQPEGLCARPLTAGEQRGLPGNPPPPDDAPRDAAPLDAPPPDAVIPDAPGMDASVADAVRPDVADVAEEPAACRDDTHCFFANAAGRCEAGRCALGACRAGFADCDARASTGCEASVADDTAHCGACGNRCNAPPNVAEVQCVAGACRRAACAVGFADCNGEASDGCEVDTRSATAHCGACGAACPDFTAPPRGGLGTTCRAGVCAYTMCASGRGDCDGDVFNGCEVDLRVTATHCGACGAACGAFPQGAVTCVGGACARACLTQQGDCDAMRENGCERELLHDPDHCGACGRRCAPDERCQLGACAATAFSAGGAVEAFAPTADVTLTSGVHRYGSVSIPAGVTVRTAGPGVLEIYARGRVLIAGTIDVSGGDGGDSALASTANCVGGNGGGGSTGTTVAGATGVAGRQNPPGTGGAGTPGGESRQPPSGLGGVYGGGAGGIPAGVGASGGGGGWAGGGGGGGSTGCTFCGGGNGAGSTRTSGLGGNGGAGGGGGGDPPAGPYTARPGVDARFGTASGGGGGGGAIGDEAVMDLSLSAAVSTFRPGSGGGGGGAASGTDAMARCVSAMPYGGGGGGGGGGALRIVSATAIEVRSSGALLARGGDGGDGAAPMGVPSGGAGGGGAGGVIDLSAPAITALGTVRAEGGRGGRGLNNTNDGGNGGPGRITLSVQISRCSLGGTVSPQLVNGCSPTPTPGTPGRVFIRATPR